MFKVADEEGGGAGGDEDLECFLEDGKRKREKRKFINFLDLKSRVYYRFQSCRRNRHQIRWNNNYGLKVLLFRFLPVLLLFLLVAIIAVQYLSRPRQSLYGNDDLDDFSSPLVTIDTNNTAALYSKYLLYTPQCILKKVPLFDQETVNLFYPVPNKKYPCPPEDPISAGIKRVNFTGVSVPQPGCQATEVERDAGDEGFRLGKTVAFGERLVVDFPTAEAVKVYCGGQTKVLPLIPFRKPIWRNKSSSSPPSSSPSTSPPSPPTSQPNILAIGVDSISRLQFLRHFNSTREFITKKRFEGPLYGLHKVGDNTFPNLIAMFTGLDMESVDELIPSPSRKLDALPLIFKQFSAKGYMTTYIEDMPNFGLWTYHEKNGFGRQQPLEYLMRPVNMLVYEELESDRKCYKGRLEMELYYDFVYDQLLAFRERRQPYLTFIHWGTLTHDEANNAGYADDPVRRLMERIFNANLQQNTLILFYSDHGIRFGPISQTESGYHESRLPFMYWCIPEGFTLGDGLDADKIRANLQLNSRRLASQFDVHATLLHILHGKPPESPPPLSADKFFLDHTFGHSLFTELPLNRTCEEAGIPEEYCLCRRFIPLTDAPSRHLLGEYILEHLNQRLAPYSANCTPLSLGRILETKVSESLSEASASTSFFSDSLLETVSVRLLMAPPSNATFDVTLRVNVNVQLVDSSGSLGAATIIEDQASIQRLSSLIRLDRYGDQSACVRNTPVESFCYCKDLL